MRNFIPWIALIACLCGTRPAAAAPDGLVLELAASSGRELQLQSIATIDRVSAARPGAGVQWRIEAAGSDGRALWTRAFAAPKRFHGGENDTPGFTVAVPAIAAGVRLTIHDDTDAVRWTRVVDEALLAAAREAGALLARDVRKALESTRQLHEDRRKRAANAPAGAAAREPAWPSPMQDMRAPDTRRAAPHKAAPAKGGNAPMHRVTGQASTDRYEVRVFEADTGRFVVSTEADPANGRFEVPLPSGRYEFEIDDNRLDVVTPYFYRSPARSGPVVVQGDMEVPAIAAVEDAGWFEFVADLPCALALQPHPYHTPLAYTPAIEVGTARGERFFRRHFQASARMQVTPPDPASTAQYCSARYRLQLTPGDYSFQFSLPGWMPVDIDTVNVRSGATTSRSHRFTLAARTLVWRGRVLGADGEPADQFLVTVADRLNGLWWWRFSGFEGDADFEIPYTPGWVVNFDPTHVEASEARKSFILDGRPLPTTVRFDEVAHESILDSGLIRIHGDGERGSRFNFLFLAEGYVAGDESWTDSNGNGSWDGIFWLDVNGNGVFDVDGDGVLGDRYRIFGSPDLALLDTPDPASGNEPFVDSNGDGILNRGEAAEFELNARDFMRAMLGADFWNEHQHAFNAWLLFEPSAQAGFDITQADGTRTLQRDTRYGANFVLPRALMLVDRPAAIQRALALLPEVDHVIILVNQPVESGARGNVFIGPTGTLTWPSGAGRRRHLESAPSHEMGHSIGILCDEYDEYTGVHPRHGVDTFHCPNVAFVADPLRVPWAGWLASGATAPDFGMDGGLGVFAGADYHPGGAYRPSFESTMRENAPLFNAPSRAALEHAVHARTGPWHHAEDPTGRCRNLPANAVHGRHDRC